MNNKVPCAVDLYKKIYPKTRKVIESALSKIVRELSTEPFKMYFLEAPTGYGKTSIPYFLSIHSLFFSDAFSKVVHVLPLRAIIRQSYSKFLQLLERMGLDKGIASIQMMGMHKTNYFEGIYTVTTFDTFLLSLFKLNPTQAWKIKKSGYFTYGHDFYTQASLLDSFVIFDEVQLALNLYSDYKSGRRGQRYSLPVVFLTSLSTLTMFKTPFLIMSATLPEPLRDKIKRIVKYALGEKYTIDEVVCDIVPPSKRNIYRRDPFFKEILGKVRTEVLDKRLYLKEICSRVVEDYKDKDRVILIFNSPENAMRAFKEIKKIRDKDDTIVLLHGRLSEVDKEYYLKKLEHLKEGKYLLIATPIVEAGVDISADIMYSERAPLDNLIQRAGRVSRYAERRGEFLVFSLKDEINVYPPYLMDKSLQLISEIREIKDPAEYGPKIDELWREAIETMKIVQKRNLVLEELAYSIYGRSRHINDLIEMAIREGEGFLREPLLSSRIEGEEDTINLPLHVCWNLRSNGRAKLMIKNGKEERSVESWKETVEAYLNGKLNAVIKGYEKKLGLSLREENSYV